MIAFLCSGCGKSLKVKDEFAGRKGKCPHCQQPMTVPSAADAARDNCSEADAKTILPPSLDADRDPKTILPAVPRGNTGLKKGNTAIPETPSSSSSRSSAGKGKTPASATDAELYDFLSPSPPRRPRCRASSIRRFRRSCPSSSWNCWPRTRRIGLRPLTRS